jgi:hypothetical protein
MEGYLYKTTAVALQNRKLAVVSKKGGVWRATLTDAGAYYLEHGTYESAPRAPVEEPRPLGLVKQGDVVYDNRAPRSADALPGAGRP